MKHLKTFNESISDSYRININYTEEEKLKNRIVRRISMKSNSDMVDRLILELKKRPKNQGFIDGLMWLMGLMGKHTWIDGQTLRISDFKNKKR